MVLRQSHAVIPGESQPAVQIGAARTDEHENTLIQEAQDCLAETPLPDITGFNRIDRAPLGQRLLAKSKP